MVVKQFREEEEEDCFLLADPKKDIKRSKGGEIVEWISRSNKKYNLAAERASKSIVELPNGRYALDFQKSRYFNDECEGFFYNKPGCYGYVSVTCMAITSPMTIKKIKGTFTFDQTVVHTSGIFEGSRVINTQFQRGAISGIEMYYTRRKEKELPNPLKQLIIQNQMVVTKKIHLSRRLIRNDGPLKKKKKIYSSL